MKGKTVTIISLFLSGYPEEKNRHKVNLLLCEGWDYCKETFPRKNHKGRIIKILYFLLLIVMPSLTFLC